VRLSKNPAKVRCRASYEGPRETLASSHWDPHFGNAPSPGSLGPSLHWSGGAIRYWLKTQLVWGIVVLLSYLPCVECSFQFSMLKAWSCCLCRVSYVQCALRLTLLLLGPGGRDYCIGSNFQKFYLTSLNPVPNAQVCVFDSTYYKITTTNYISKTSLHTTFRMYPLGPWLLKT
jgi:hypothetical protein